MLKQKPKLQRKLDHEGDDVHQQRKVQQKGEAVNVVPVANVALAVKEENLLVNEELAARNAEAAVRRRVALKGVDVDDKLHP
ncbi:MAG: hypothetical protein ACE5RT_07190 [Nitrosopumilaceae archaeon]